MNKVIAITGASSGIGLAIAQMLVEKKYTVYCLARNKPTDERINFIYCDVSNRDTIEFSISQIIEEQGRLDCIVNNAGVGISGPVEYEPADDIERIINVNLLGVVNSSAVALPHLRESKGMIVNISSVASEYPIPFQALYTATKEGVKGFSLALKNEVRPLGVRVTCLLPGDVKTDFTKNRVKANEEQDTVYRERVERSVARMEKDEQNGMSPWDIAAAVCKVIEKKNPPTTFTVGAQYKLLRFLKRILPEKFINYILFKMYGK